MSWWNITLQETRLYQDIKEEGRREGMRKGVRKIILRQLTKRFGEIPEEIKSQIEKLSLEQLENLGEGVLDLMILDDLVSELQKIQITEQLLLVGDKNDENISF
ncbi:MAG TPA: DUF4351 domain-containing protein [Nostocaceae cyanobacterium]|nr:DUF4351 domain-containing protein [Nostocaceae cyanobacterium]